MTCNKCASGNLRGFKAELVVSFRSLENLNQAPVHVIQDVAVCLDCGHVELTLPPVKLEQLKQGAFEEHSPSSGQAGSINS